jgi:hypothetical protein
MRPAFLLLAFALVGWGLCGATIGIGRQIWPLDEALIVHAMAAPVVFGILGYLHARRFAFLRPLPTASICVGVVLVMDAGVVAPFVEHSFSMFRSPLGTWLPFGLIFLAVWGASRWVMGPGPGWLWQATAGESRRPLPGDDRLARTQGQSTHGITIDAPPNAVWPWLVQMGCGRAGWYSHDRLDNGGRPSSERILPEFQSTEVGDVLPSRPGHREGFEVLDLHEPRHLVLGAYFTYPVLAQLRWDAPEPARFTRATWAFALDTVGGGRTRLLVRTRGTGRPAWLNRLMGGLMTVAHAIMQRRQLLGLKARAEAGRGRTPARGGG